jgi:hypothetical protein
MRIPAMSELDGFVRLIANVREILGEPRFRRALRKIGYAPITTDTLGTLIPLRTAENQDSVRESVMDTGTPS